MTQNLIDQTGRKISLNDLPPRKVISTVPSITETLFFLSDEPGIAGITRFCTHPAEKLSRIPIIGGTKTLRLSKIEAINPDLIICNKEENVREQVERLMRRFTVYLSDVKNLSDACALIRDLGTILRKAQQASDLVEKLGKKQESLSQLERSPAQRVLYLIWKDPYMSIGRDTYIHAMLEQAGYQNVCYPNIRYPILTEDQLSSLMPDHVFLSSEPYPFRDVHKEHIQKMLPAARIHLVDGRYFSWYGSASLCAMDYFMKLNQEML